MKDIIDHNMNCEDIAMNFLISSHTGLPPIKVSAVTSFTTGMFVSVSALNPLTCVTVYNNNTMLTNGAGTLCRL